MGNTPSSSAVQTCLKGAVGNDVAFKSDPLYQLVHVKPYNLGVPSVPAAVTYPRTADQVSKIVKCAVDNALKVQPRSGGHSYANYGTYILAYSAMDEGAPHGWSWRKSSYWYPDKQC